jgi:hypothetical protein
LLNHPEVTTIIMPSRKAKKHHAMARGAAEGICSSLCCPSYEEAEAYMREHGCTNFFVDQELPSERKLVKKYYAVAWFPQISGVSSTVTFTPSAGATSAASTPTSRRAGYHLRSPKALQPHSAE